MIARRPFGRTGHHSTVTLFGAAALARASQAEADRTLELLLRHGVNHIDTAARYGDSELRIGPWMARHRQGLLPGDQDRPAHRARGPRGHPPLARAAPRRPRRPDPAPLPRPSRRLGAGHGTGRARSRPSSRRAPRDSCASSASPGHGWTIAAMHRRSLARFDFDSVLLPYNYFMAQDERYRQRLRRAARDLPGASGRRSGHQVARARPVGHHRADSHHLVSAARRAERHRSGGALGARRSRTCS